MPRQHSCCGIANLWLVGSFYVRATCISFTRFGLWTRKIFVKRVPCDYSMDPLWMITNWRFCYVQLQPRFDTFMNVYCAVYPIGKCEGNIDLTDGLSLKSRADKNCCVNSYLPVYWGCRKSLLVGTRPNSPEILRILRERNLLFSQVLSIFITQVIEATWRLYYLNQFCLIVNATLWEHVSVKF